MQFGQELAEAGEEARHRAPPHVLACLGVRYDPLDGRFEPPGEATIRRVLERVDADALDAAQQGLPEVRDGRDRYDVQVVKRGNGAWPNAPGQ